MPAVLGLVACGSGDPAPAASGTYDVVLVEADAAGGDHEEPWTVECGDDACTVQRAAGPPLGEVTEIGLERTDGGGYSGDAHAGCTSVDVEMDVDDDVIVGSIALGGCGSGTLGFSGSRAG